jgi:hypothetical protein
MLVVLTLVYVPKLGYVTMSCALCEQLVSSFDTPRVALDVYTRITVAL